MYSDLRELARSKKLPVILAMMCFLAAIWMEFGPQSQPGTEELREGQIISLTASTNAEREKACDLFRQAFTKGNINASIALSHCLSITYPNIQILLISESSDTRYFGKRLSRIHWMQLCTNILSLSRQLQRKLMLLKKSTFKR